jgi:sorbitol-specific phosphotransferase system component IIA
MRLHAATAIRGLGHIQIYFKENSPTAISSPRVLKSPYTARSRMRLHAATVIRGLGHVQIYFKENSPTAISSPGVLKSPYTARSACGYMLPPLFAV